MVAQQAEMEDIISSIRSTVAEEKAKVDVAGSDDEVLELSADELVEAPAQAVAPAADGDLFDISAFAASGEVKSADSAAVEAAAADMLGEAPAAAPVPMAMEDVVAEIASGVEAAAEPAPVAAPEAPAAAPAAAEGGADEFDKLLAQISEDQQKKASVAEENKQALMAEEVPLGAEMVVDEPVAEVAPEAQAALAKVAEGVNGYAASFQALGDVNGLQVALPAEVLALALRPMIQEWLKANLAGVVERLVKDEIAKLSQV